MSGGEEYFGRTGFFVRHVQLSNASDSTVGHEVQSYETAGDGSMIPPSLEVEEWGGEIWERQKSDVGKQN